MGVCSQPEKAEEYTKCIEKVMGFLEGNDDKPLADLVEKMNNAAINLEFEKAAKYREYLKGVRHVLNKQRLIRSSQSGRNIICFESINDSRVKAFFIKGNKMVGVEVISIDKDESSLIKELLKNSILDYFGNFYAKFGERIGQKDIDEAQIMYLYIKKKKGSIEYFWIPSNWAKNDNSRLEAGISKIIKRLFSQDG